MTLSELLTTCLCSAQTFYRLHPRNTDVVPMSKYINTCLRFARESNVCVLLLADTRFSQTKPDTWRIQRLAIDCIILKIGQLQA